MEMCKLMPHPSAWTKNILSRTISILSGTKIILSRQKNSALLGLLDPIEDGAIWKSVLCEAVLCKA